MNMETERQGAACARVSGRSWLLLGLAGLGLAVYGGGRIYGDRWLVLSAAAEAPAAGGVAQACGREGQSSCRAAAFRVQ